MTNEQINWAKTHDWFLDVIDDDILGTGQRGVLVLDVSFDREGVRHETTRVFHGYRRLRDWAGY